MYLYIYIFNCAYKNKRCTIQSVIFNLIIKLIHLNDTAMYLKNFFINDIIEIIY